MTVGQLLSEPNRFQIPEYQRAYSWTTKEAGHLLDDLLVAATEALDDGDYFLGAMLFMGLDQQSGAGGDAASEPLVQLHDIVDGQQRLVTLTILICVLRDLAFDRSLPWGRTMEPLVHVPGGSGHLRLVLPARAGQFLQRFVQDRGASAIMPDADEPSDEEDRILSVREHFMAELIGYSDDELEAFATFVAQSCQFAVIVARTLDRAHRMFSVLNNRGRPLARNDILKAQVLGAIPAESRSVHAANWSRIEEQLGDDFETLFSHIRSIEGRTRVRILDGIGDVIATYGPERFMTDVLEPYAAIFAKIRHRDRSDTALPPRN